MLLHRRTIRGSLGAWCEEALAPYEQSPQRVHRLLIRELEAVARRETPRLMFALPPGSAKSTYASVLFPPWLFASRPGVNFIGASNTDRMAQKFSRRVMTQIRANAATLGYALASEAAESWETTNGCTYRAAGVGAAIAGERADVVLIDDPVRTRQDAESATVRESQWDWFTSDLRSRLKPDAAIVLVSTRWHQDDLAGRLLERQPGLWRVVSVPAVAGPNDPLGRAEGEWLWDDDPSYPYGAELRKLRAEHEKAGSTRDWASLYQQTPRAAGGNLFKTAQIAVLDAVPADCGPPVRAWDLAGSKQIGTSNPDWTVGVKLTRRASGQFVVLDVVRLRGDPAEVEAAIVNTAAQDGRHVRVGLPQDPGQAGRAQAMYLTSKLAGFAVEASPETGAKETRALPVVAQCCVGNLAMVRAPWNAAVLDELASFPGGRHDDIPDALSRAFGMLAAPVAPSAAERFRAMI